MIDLVTQAAELIYELFLDGFLALMAVAVVAPLLGVHLVMRRMPLLGLAVPQMAGAGQAGAFWAYGAFVLSTADAVSEPGHALQAVGSGAGVLIGLALLVLFGRDARMTGVWAGVLFLVAVASQEIFYLESPYHRIFEEAIHHGRILTVDASGRTRVLAVCGAALVVVLWAGRRLWTTAFDADEARLQGRSPAAWLFLTLVLLGGVSAICVPVVGPEVVLCLLLIPPAVLRAATPSVRLYGPLSSLAGALGAASSFVVACAEELDWPPGPALVLTTLIASLLVAAVVRVACWRRIRGWAGRA